MYLIKEILLEEATRHQVFCVRLVDCSEIVWLVSDYTPLYNIGLVVYQSCSERDYNYLENARGR